MKNFNRGGGFGGDRGNSGNGGFRGGFGGGFGGGGGRSFDRPKEFFKAVCDECGRDCEVPFRPTGSRPVLCSNCFEAKNGPRPQRSARPDDNTRVRRFERDGSPIETREERENRNISMLRDEIVKLNEKIDRLVETLSAPKIEEKTKKAKAAKKVTKDQ